MLSRYAFDTPALLIDRDILLGNIRDMQARAQRLGVALRPHTKTHKCPDIARMQLDAGACGIAVAKTGEAEVMARAGLRDIFIANQVVGADKLARVRALHRDIDIRIGVDSPEGVRQIERAFAGEPRPLRVLAEIETGERRCGLNTEAQAEALMDALRRCPHVRLDGLFSHEGHTYRARDKDDCVRLFDEAQRLTLDFAALFRAGGFAFETVSVGATPSCALGRPLPGVTEFRPGTYALMDVSQASGLDAFDRCAASVLTTVISRPTPERFVTDAGAKALTKERRTAGMCSSAGMGLIRGTAVSVTELYDEHGITYDKELRDALRVGDKLEIIPNHICPVCNLYERAYLVSDGMLVKQLDIAAGRKIE